jgi:uncharacterized protein YndB with AHSA1/START domain
MHVGSIVNETDEGGAWMRQVEIKDQLTVDAGPATVWAAIKDPSAHAAWHPFLTEITGAHEAGAERVCSVNLAGKASHTRERCITEQPHQRIIWRIDEDTSGFSRMVSDWTAGFSLTPANGGTLVTAESAFRPRNPFVRLMMPMIRRKFHQTQKAILEGLKRYTDSGDAAPGRTR